MRSTQIMVAAVVSVMSAGLYAQGTGDSTVMDSSAQQSQQGTTIGQLQSAPSAEYWVADASLFIRSATNATEIMQNYPQLDTISAEVISDQAQFLTGAIDRARQDLQQLQSQAQTQMPEALAPLEQSLSQLEQSYQQAESLSQSAMAGQLDTSLAQTIAQTRSALNGAQQSLDEVARAIGAEQFSTQPSSPQQQPMQEPMEQ